VEVVYATGRLDDHEANLLRRARASSTLVVENSGEARKTRGLTGKLKLRSSTPEKKAKRNTEMPYGSRYRSLLKCK